MVVRCCHCCFLLIIVCIAKIRLIKFNLEFIIIRNNFNLFFVINIITVEVIITVNFDFNFLIIVTELAHIILIIELVHITIKFKFILFIITFVSNSESVIIILNDTNCVIRTHHFQHFHKLILVHTSQVVFSVFILVFFKVIPFTIICAIIICCCIIIYG